MQVSTTLLCLITALLWQGLVPERAAAQALRIQNGPQISLQKQLETGLQARRPEEFAFIARVSILVDQQKLPRKLVQETFAWARKKKRYPYVYFQRALQVRAARMGIEL